MRQIILNRAALFDKPIKQVFWHYTEEGAIPQDLLEHGVVFRQGPPSLEDYPLDDGEKILVLDDMLGKISDEIVDFYLRASHHRRLSCFLLCQNLYNKKIREISLNSHVVIVFKSRRDLSQIRHFCLQVDPANWRSIFASYRDATDQPGHHYLLFDFHAKTPDCLRFRTKILPHEKQVVYVMKKKL